MFLRTANGCAAAALVITAELLLLLQPRPARAQLHFSVGADIATSYPSDLTSFPDEDVTFFPYPSIDGYLLFASSGIQGGMGGAVVLQTQDLQTFNYATTLGYAQQVMNPPVAFTSCNASYNSEFDENYSGPGTVVQDPTLPPGNLIMIYEAENHCPGGVWQFDYYATVGLARSSDNGQTWPAPIDAEFGGPNRYPVLKSSTPEPTTAENPQVNLGDAIPSAYIDGDYLYVIYEYVNSPSAPSDNLMRVARANLITDNVGGTLQFHKWYNGAFSQPGIGGLDSSPLPSAGCSGVQRQGSISRNDVLGLYLMLFVCIDNAAGQGAWYYSVATSLDQEDWTPPRMIAGSLGPVYNPCTGVSAGGEQFDGWYPSFMSPNAPQGHTQRTGRVYFLNGCEGSTLRAFVYRNFTITGDFASHDFNGDGYSDILWQDTSGDVAMWLMNGATVSQSSGVGNANPSVWSIVGQRDFNGDGKADILWHDTSGDVAVWFMNGAQVIQSSYIGTAPASWSIVGTGDFFGNGNGDILWRDTSGDVAIWELSGSTIVQSCGVGTAPTSWSIVGTGDFNGDGMTDILWHDTAGDVAIWEMNGCSILQSAGVGTVNPSVWSIAGTGDFNGDGMSDILWHDTSGDVAIWEMNGAAILQSSYVGTANPSVWSIAQTGDYYAAGTSDILWRDTSGDVAVWQMNGATIVQSAYIGKAPTVWSIQGAGAD